MVATSAQAPNPYEDPGPWGRCFVGGLMLPGVITDITGHDRIQAWLIQKGVGASYAATVWRGADLMESIKITLNLYDRDQFSSYTTIAKALTPKANAGPRSGPTKAYNVENAAINWAGCTRVGIRSFGTPRVTTGLSWLAVVDLIEFKLMKPAPIGPPDAPKAKTENDRLADEVAEKAKEAAAFGAP